MYSELASQTKEYFERHEGLYFTQKVKITSITSVNKKALQALYFDALGIAPPKKSHSILEELILRAAVGIQKLKAIPLSDNTVSITIADMSEDIRYQLIARLQQVKFEFPN
ncbi:hypothetical protein RF11_07391 [Thelohanellus kitauei]|uniref:Uncharacterized protein n=1 Tax=Thelohanellus kitauei TaxID=669202 RepID=A0A0C2JB34_THEKT|nr:hypothetical protein RF11_07391 [Thelohanellus kitauei]